MARGTGARGRARTYSRTRRIERAHAESYESIGKWLAAIAGPVPDARLAHEAVVTVLRDPTALFHSVYGLLWKTLGDRVLDDAIHVSFLAALLDRRITRDATQRPSLAEDDAKRTIAVIATPIDLDASPDSLLSMWVRMTTEWPELMGTHHFLESSDLPIVVSELVRSFQVISLDGAVEDAEVRLQVLLQEAQEARQWSIPWGGFTTQSTSRSNR